ncbi:hypothetical protein RMATCC62417_13169 [Rhizopus microsporus]|nr:hypothetical protein RMATCC62417_13169 [Rhizopus microsporus]
MTENNTNDTQNSDVGIEKIALQIKSLEQRTTSVTLPRNASVLQLKHEIQIAFDVECNRQRLIFQGRVLKDDKHLTDYANLDNGKVIHLVIRPADAPHNPQNDDPNPGTTNTTRSSRLNGRPFPFSSLSSRFPMMEGYAFITLDSAVGEPNDNHSLISSVLNGLTSGTRSRSPSTQTTTPTTDSTSNNPNRTSGLSAASSLFRSPFAFSFSHRGSSGEQRSPFASSLGFPPSVEVRLARTLVSIRNVRSMLQESNNLTDESSIPSFGTSSTSEQLQEVRNSMRNNGGPPLSQIGMALEELADLIETAAPHMRDTAEQLRAGLSEDNRAISRRVLFISRVIQGMSLINHFMGSILASMEIDSRRTRSTQPRPTTPATPTTRGETTALRTNPPTVSSSSSLSTNSVEPSSSSTSTSNGLKRKCEESEEDDSSKRIKQEKGKGKDKTD